jgi:hypothetical protein
MMCLANSSACPPGGANPWIGPITGPAGKVSFESREIGKGVSPQVLTRKMLHFSALAGFQIRTLQK